MPATRPATETGDCTAPGRSSALLLDLVERLAVVIFFGWFIYRNLAGYWAGGEVVSLLLLPSEGLVVLFILIRRTTRDVSTRPTEWLLAIAASVAPLLVIPVAGQQIVPSMVAVVFILGGLLVQLHAKITLGRCFGLIPANRGLKRAGPYRVVRHPMYTGYLISHVGFLLMNPTIWNLSVYAVCYSLQIPRLLAEERILSADPKYVNYSERVRYRLLPGIF